MPSNGDQYCTANEGENWQPNTYKRGQRARSNGVKTRLAKRDRFDSPRYKKPDREANNQVNPAE